MNKSNQIGQINFGNQIVLLRFNTDRELVEQEDSFDFQLLENKLQEMWYRELLIWFGYRGLGLKSCPLYIKLSQFLIKIRHEFDLNVERTCELLVKGCGVFRSKFVLQHNPDSGQYMVRIQNGYSKGFDTLKKVWRNKLGFRIGEHHLLDVSGVGINFPNSVRTFKNRENILCRLSLDLMFMTAGKV